MMNQAGLGRSEPEDGGGLSAAPYVNMEEGSGVEGAGGEATSKGHSVSFNNVDIDADIREKMKRHSEAENEGFADEDRSQTYAPSIVSSVLTADGISDTTGFALELQCSGPRPCRAT